MSHIESAQDVASPRLPRRREPPTPLTSVAVVCRSRPEVSAISDVVQTIDRFVGADAKWTITMVSTWNSKRHATAPGLPGELRLLKRLAAREDLDLDPIFKRKYFSDALGLALYRDKFEIFQWLVDEYLPLGRIRNEVEHAVSKGQSRTIHWLWEHHRSRVVWTPTLVVFACVGGHAELAKWLHVVVGLEVPVAPEMIKTCAINNGHLDLLQWAVELGAPIGAGAVVDATKSWSAQCVVGVVPVKNLRVGQLVMVPSDPGGRLEVVRWLARHPGVDLMVSGRDVKYGSAALVPWALENLTVEHKKSLVEGIDAAASRNDLELVKMLHENSTGGACTTTATLSKAGRTTDAMDDAASAGHLDVVKWLHENRSEGCTTKAMDGAAGHGHLDVVKWLHEHRTEGCTTKAMDDASANGHLSVIEWLHNNRHEGCTTKAMDGAATNGHLNVVQWLHSNRTDGCTTKAMDDVARNGHLDVVQWLHANRHEGCTTRAMDQAAAGGHLDIIQWLHDHRTEGCTADAIMKAARRGHIHVAQWLVATGLAQVTWELVIPLIGYDQVDAVKWILPLLSGELGDRSTSSIGSLVMAQVLQADGRFPVGTKENYYRAMEVGDWQFFEWLLWEYPDAMLTPREVERVTRQENYEHRARGAYMQDAIFEFEQLGGVYSQSNRLNN